MRTRYKYITAVFILLLILPSCMVASAHPGRTDANGGHYDRSTGEYHYHHGYPAHQHENGECPYDFDDKTGENSGGSSSGERSLPPVETTEDRTMSSVETTEEYMEQTTTINISTKKKNISFDTISEIVIGVIIYGIVLGPIIGGLISAIIKRIK